MVGEKLMMIVTSGRIIASRCTPVASGANPSHGHAIHANAMSPSIATMSVVTVIGDGGQPPAQTLEVEREPGNQRDERGGDAGDHLELIGHQLVDEIAEDAFPRYAEQQIARQPRQLKPTQRVACDPGPDEREPKCEGRPADPRRCATDTAHPDDGRNGEEAPRVASFSGSALLPVKLAITSEPIAPTAATARIGASGPARARR